MQPKLPSLAGVVSSAGALDREVHKALAAMRAARAQGKVRFEHFVEQLGRHLLRGRSLVRDVVEELHPDPMRMENAAAAAQAQAQERAS